ncbi:MAG: cell division protein SepF [Clostridia bacterium]|jgi:cell division inhibitor SepF|nr:cell division protein SepF [Clostridia bacterium]
MGKFLNFIGLEENDDEEILNDEAQPEQPKREPRSRRRENALVGGGDPQPVPSSVASMKMIVYHPVCYDDAQSIVDNLKNRRPVIVNMEELDGNCAQRVLDFLLGSIYALNGTINKISRGIFLVAPRDVDVEDTGEDSGYTDM